MGNTIAGGVTAEGDGIDSHAPSLDVPATGASVGPVGMVVDVLLEPIGYIPPAEA